MLKRTPLKRGSSTLKKTAIKKVSKESLTNIIDRVSEGHRLKEFYFKIWNSRPHICVSCGCSLGNELRSYHIEHLLEKSKYPELIDEPLNIMLVCLDCHTKKTNGNPTKKHQEEINKVKELFT